MLDRIEILDGYDKQEIQPFRILEGEFSGLVIRLGKAWFEGEDNLCFEMDILEGKIDDEQSARLNQFLGSIIMEFIKNEISLREESNNDQSEN
jgi:hypothetical protein